jgi:hypothetical protein
MVGAVIAASVTAHQGTVNGVTALESRKRLPGRVLGWFCEYGGSGADQFGRVQERWEGGTQI